MLQLEGVMRRETICLLLILSLGLGSAAIAQEPETLTIAILRDGDSPYFDDAAIGIGGVDRR